MGRKKSLHPSDVLRRKQRRKELRRLQAQRQKARKEGLRRLAPDKLLQGIRKFNRLEVIDGRLDERTKIKRKNLMMAYADVVNKQKESEAKKTRESHVSISGISKILGKIEEVEAFPEKKETTQKQEEIENHLPDNQEKENLAPITLEDLEFPPGLPRPIHLCPPPGIRPRPQKQLEKPSVNEQEIAKKKAFERRQNNAKHQFSGPNVQVLGVHAQGRKRRRNENVEDLFDPMNPENPFFQQHPKRQNVMTSEVRKLERQQQREARRAARNPFPNNNQMRPQMPAPQLSEASYGPALPIEGASNELPALPDASNDGKLEILLPDKMRALAPTSLRVKRQRHTKKKKQQLELAPVVGRVKPKKRKDRKKKVQSTEYDAFLAEIELLM